MFEGGRAVERVEAGKGEYGYVEIDPTGRYGRFSEILGKGATKTVYRAFDELQGMEVAWNQAKLNDVFRSPEELERLYSEVHLLSTVNHDSIIHFHASWIDVEKRTINFITEMFTSGTLREYRRRYKRVNIRAVKNWACQILHGLVYLHGHDPPVIHRDLKCDNIFVNGHLGQVKIGDLGLAAILRGSQAAHSVIGTPEFMAPELYEEEYNELVDIYSFGMCVLEMLTSEYPYSECSNPAQIYKKVTSGKLPDAFYRIHDFEAQRFIGKCLESASKRSSAKELLLDPFLALDEGESLPILKCGGHENMWYDVELDSRSYRPSPDVHQRSAVTKRTDMTITGKMNPEDDTIFLKVQIADKDGNLRNIYFPFDIITDTPIDVATEMVKELEISDRDPFEIAEVIGEEISALVPHWKEWGQSQSHKQYTFSYEDDEDNEAHHPFYYPSSPSSQASVIGLLPSQGACYHTNCPQDEFPEDDTSSQSSLQSGKYSNMNYNSNSDHEHDLSPRRQDFDSIIKSHKSSRFCPEENKIAHSTLSKCCSQFSSPQSSHVPGRSGHKAVDNRRLTRIRSMVDVRSQLLHRSLVEEVNKRRLFRTVGDVESIGFQAPSELPRKALMFKGSSSRAHGAGKREGLTWR